MTSPASATAQARPVSVFGTDDLAERGFVPGARVAFERLAFCYGTIVSMRNDAEILVDWDDGYTLSHCWIDLTPLGYVLPNTADWRLTDEARALAAGGAST